MNRETTTERLIRLQQERDALWAVAEKWLAHAEMNRRAYQNSAGEDVPLVAATRRALNPSGGSHATG